MAPPNRPKRPQPNRSNNGLIVILAVAGIVVVLGIVAAILLAGGADDDDDAAPSASLTPSGVAICDADAGAGTTDTTPDDDVTLAPFPDDDIFKPVSVVGDVLPDFSAEVQSGEAPDLALCEKAPVISGYDYTGDEITIDPANRGSTLVVLLAHWCPHCNREVPVLNEWRDSGNVPDDLNVVGVSTGIRPEQVNYPPDEWLTAMDWTWPVLADTDVSTALRAYGGTTFPTMVLIGSDGRVLARFSGEFPVDVIQQIVDDGLAQDAANAG